MKAPTSRGLVLLLAVFALTSVVSAQTAPRPAAGAATTSRETVTLTAFEVTEDASDTYQATNTNAVTGTNTALGKTPSTPRSSTGS